MVYQKWGSDQIIWNVQLVSLKIDPLKYYKIKSIFTLQMYQKKFFHQNNVISYVILFKIQYEQLLCL